jgi:hypothetical protein
MNSDTYDSSDAYKTFAYCKECKEQRDVTCKIADVLSGKPLRGFAICGHTCEISDEQAQLERKRIADGHR